MTHPNRPFVGGNWKMNLRLASAVELAEDLHAALSNQPLAADLDAVVFPPYPYLQAVGRALGHGPPQLGAQDLADHEDGAFTGQVSAGMLDDLDARWVIVGHSERRHGLEEPESVLHRKLVRALTSDLKAVFCVGETLAERESGMAEEVLARQVRSGFSGVDRGLLAAVVLAYEPVWAIGTGENATPLQAGEAHKFIRRWVATRLGTEAGEAVRILYGGSVNPGNVKALMSVPDVDGVLVGGASLKPDTFLPLIEFDR